ncbi:MAG TPA: isoaspartyl peptidase/L-asparaginase, partial [Phycisphaerales bacterium]|nr:isoaspartyl peptidase/L-asparaginase [Phycisphaerales bacterium]
MPAPIILSTWSFARNANNAAFPALLAGGSALDAVEKVATLVEADQNVDSVGFGGLPDSAGHVSLDACIMTHPNRCGSVCAMRRFMHPVSIARKVMEQTPHIMIAGEGADAFAIQQGFMPADLLSADALDAYEKWKKDHATPDQSRDRFSQRQQVSAMRPVDHGEAKPGKLFFHPAPPDFDESRWKHHDTVGTLALDSTGALAGACSTSGTPYKLPGRVGDSPIIGHGLYVHQKDGAATATGAGEL